MTLKLITFDVTNTLLKIRGSVGEHYATVANRYFGATGKWFGSEKTEKAFVHAYKEVDTLMPNFGYHNNISSEVWWYEVVHRVFYNLGLHDIGILKSISNQLYTDYCASTRYQLFPETKTVLRQLKAETGIKIGIISNFDERLDLLLEQLEIRKYLDFILCSRSVGMAKPGAKIFKTALALCDDGIQPKEALHVGDNLKLDYIAARDAGLNSLLINRGKKQESLHQSDPSVVCIYTLESLLPSHLQNLEPFKKFSFQRRITK